MPDRDSESLRLREGAPYSGWRCRDCGTIVAGDGAQHGDEIAIKIMHEGGGAPTGAIGCPCCPYQTMTDPVTVTVTRRLIAL